MKVYQKGKLHQYIYFGDSLYPGVYLFNNDEVFTEVRSYYHTYDENQRLIAVSYEYDSKVYVVNSISDDIKCIMYLKYDMVTMYNEEYFNQIQNRLYDNAWHTDSHEVDTPWGFK